MEIREALKKKQSRAAAEERADCPVAVAADGTVDVGTRDAAQSSESARGRDWMHRLRPGDIVLVSTGTARCLQLLLSATL